MSVPALLCGLAVLLALLLPSGSRARERRQRLRASPAPGRVPRAGRRPPDAAPSTRAIRGAATIAGVAVAVVAGGRSGLLAGPVTAVALAVLLPRSGLVQHGAARARRAAIAAELPLTLDLLAAVLAAGGPPQRAVAVVAAAVTGPLGPLLSRVVAASELGAGPEEMWQVLASEPALRGVVRTAERSARTGASLADALRSLAAEERQAALAGAEEAARRAGVLAVGPLGLCFLPAFVLVAVVPTVAGLARGVLVLD